MVHGSGALDLNETVFQNKPFRDIAEGLAACGVSTLRYDKRTFTYRKPVSSMDEETILDALSAIRTARRYGRKVYLLGHSLGAMLAPVIALKAEEELAGIIMMAAPARDLEEVVREQIDYLLPSGASQDFKNTQLEALRQQNPHYFIPQHQTEAATRLTCPIFILQGERDYQVPMKDYEQWKKTLEGHRNASFRSYPKLNHLFMEGEGKSSPLEYQTESHVADTVVNDLAAFILNPIHPSN